MDTPDHRPAEWRADIDSLAFQPKGHTGCCVVHRRAFETLVGHHVSAEDCATYFEDHRASFERAAANKITREALQTGENFHLTSRDIARIGDH